MAQLATGHLPLLLALFTIVAFAQATPTHQFDNFFPGWNARIQEILNNECKGNYSRYKTGNLTGATAQGALVNPLVGCILEQFPEYRKQELSVSAVVLGLIPTLLQTIGSPTVETAFVGLQSPLLGFLLSAGTPALSWMRTEGFDSAITSFLNPPKHEDNDDDDDDEDQDDKDNNDENNSSTRYTIVEVIEYILVILAVINVADLARRLGINAVAIFAPNTVFGVPLWTYLAVLIHLGGVAAIAIRVRISPIHGAPLTPWETVLRWISPTAFQRVYRLDRQKWGRWLRGRYVFYSLIWLINIGSLVQTAFGTLVLSGLLFFSLTDCLIILGRYVLSTLVCRAVVSWEVSKMRARMVGRPGLRRARALRGDVPLVCVGVGGEADQSA